MAKTGLRIRIIGDPVLRKKAKKVEKVTDRHRQLLRDMQKFMVEARGVGLAAPQIGMNESLIVCDIGSGCHKLINPRIVEKDGEQAIEEGCLSVPGIYVKVRRAGRIVVEALDENGEPVRMEAKDMLAIVLQHEIDHLNGKLIYDYVPFRQKLEIELKVREMLDEEKSPVKKRKTKEP